MAAHEVNKPRETIVHMFLVCTSWGMNSFFFKKLVDFDSLTIFFFFCLGKQKNDTVSLIDERRKRASK